MWLAQTHWGLGSHKVKMELGSSEIEESPINRTDFKEQAHLWKLGFGFAESLVLRSCVELGIPDIINNNGGRISLSNLASDLPCPDVRIDVLSRIMRFMVHMNLFNQEVTQEGNKIYGLEPVAELLLKDAERSMAPIVLGMLQRDFTFSWHHLKHAIVGDGSTAYESAMGMTIWEYLEAHPEKNKLFNEVMASDTRLLAASLVSSCKDIFGKLESVVDVGGGSGTNLRAISLAFPQLNCTVFDLPHVIENSPDVPGLNRVGGDMFEFIPTAQAIMLKLVLHDWSDEDCVKILKKCKEAVPREGGKVIIVEVVLDEKEEDHQSMMLVDIDMMVNTGGKERTEEDWKLLILERAGYKKLKIRYISEFQSLIEAFPY